MLYALSFSNFFYSSSASFCISVIFILISDLYLCCYFVVDNVIIFILILTTVMDCRPHVHQGHIYYERSRKIVTYVKV